MLDSGFIDNVEVGAIFFAIDFVVTAVTLPWFLRRTDNRKWMPMRREIIGELFTCHQRILNALREDFTAIFDLYLSQHIVSRHGADVFDTSQAREHLANARSELKQVIDIYAPAMQPDMARAVIDLVGLPSHIIAALGEIDVYLTELLHYDSSKAARIVPSRRDLRHTIHHDIYTIGAGLRQALEDLGTVSSQTHLAAVDARTFAGELEKITDEQGELLAAADGLMELLTHRDKYYFDNVRYPTLDAWLVAHEIPYSQTLAIRAFGDADVLAAFYAAPASVRRYL